MDGTSCGAKHRQGTAVPPLVFFLFHNSVVPLYDTVEQRRSLCPTCHGNRSSNSSRVIIGTPCLFSARIRSNKTAPRESSSAVFFRKRKKQAYTSTLLSNRPSP